MSRRANMWAGFLDRIRTDDDGGDAILKSIGDAKGDLIAFSAADTPARLAVGANGRVLTADSTAPTGLAWAEAAGGVEGFTTIVDSDLADSEGSPTGIELGDEDTGEVRIMLDLPGQAGGSVIGSFNNNINDDDWGVEGLNLFRNAWFAAFQSEYPDRQPPFVELNFNEMNFIAPDADAGTPTRSHGIIRLGSKWWDGGDSVDADVVMQSLWASPTQQAFRVLFGYQGSAILILCDDNGEVAATAYELKIYPQNNDSGSLGIAGKTWGNIFATLPTSDPNVAGQFWSDSGTVKVSAG